MRIAPATGGILTLQMSPLSTVNGGNTLDTACHPVCCAQGDPFRTLFVARLSYEVTEKKLKREFEEFGPVRRVRIVTDKSGAATCSLGAACWGISRGQKGAWTGGCVQMASVGSLGVQLYTRWMCLIP